MPATSVPRMTPSVTSTLRAFRPSGGLNALTALDTASMPVSDEPPLAKLRSRVRMMAAAARLETPVPLPYRPCRWAMFCCGRWPAASLISPVAIISSTAPENR